MNTSDRLCILSIPITAAVFSLCMIVGNGDLRAAQAVTNQHAGDAQVAEHVADGAELKKAVLDATTPNSATITTESVMNSEDAEGNHDVRVRTDVIKIDAQGDTLKTNDLSRASDGETRMAFTEGEDCVVVIDGTARSSTPADQGAGGRQRQRLPL